MPNKNYLAGRRFEYARMKFWKSQGAASVMRTAGSHGPFDIFVINQQGNITGIQCKRVEKETQARLLIRKFRENPPFKQAKFHQTIEIYVKETRSVMNWTV